MNRSLCRRPRRQTRPATYLLEIAARTDFVSGVVGWVDLARPGVGAVVADLRNGEGGHHLVGVRRDRAGRAAKLSGLRGHEGGGQLARALALDWADEGIRVNAVCPGIVDTPMLRSFVEGLPDPETAWRAHERVWGAETGFTRRGCTRGSVHRGDLGVRRFLVPVGEGSESWPLWVGRASVERSMRPVVVVGR
jgi:Enoyl-(Acyl carrier protein) reductase